MYMNQAYHIRLMNNVNADHVFIASESRRNQLFFVRMEVVNVVTMSLRPFSHYLLSYFTSKKRSGVHISDLRERFRGFILVSVFVFFTDETIVCGKIVSEGPHVFLNGFLSRKQIVTGEGRGIIAMEYAVLGMNN